MRLPRRSQDQPPRDRRWNRGLRAWSPARSGRLRRPVRLTGGLRSRYVPAPIGRYPEIAGWEHDGAAAVGDPALSGRCSLRQGVFAIGDSRPDLIPELLEQRPSRQCEQSRCNVPDFYSRAKIPIEDRSVTLNGDATSNPVFAGSRLPRSPSPLSLCRLPRPGHRSRQPSAWPRSYSPVLSIDAQRKPCGPGEAYRPTSVDVILGRKDVLLRDSSRNVVTRGPDRKRSVAATRRVAITSTSRAIRSIRAAAMRSSSEPGMTVASRASTRTSRPTRRTRAGWRSSTGSTTRSTTSPT